MTANVFAAPAAVLLATCLAIGAGWLTTLSVDRGRRLVWTAAAFAGAASAIRVALGPVTAFELRDLPQLVGVRGAFAAPLRRLIAEPESAILVGIVLGDRSGIARDVAESFTRSGTSHLLAISGFNMTLVAAAIALVLRGRARPIVCAGTSIAAVLAYSAVVGFSASVMRAALMACVAAIGLAFGHRSAAANALCAAVCAMLLADPGSIDDVGLILSAAATAGLIAWQAPLAELLRPRTGPLAPGLAATLAATIPTLPVIAAVFGRVSLVSPLANLLAVPLFPPLMLAGLATSALGVLSIDAARPIAIIAFGFTFALRSVVETAAAVPLASIAVPDGLAGGAAAVAAIVTMRVVCTRVRVRVPSLPRPRTPPPRLAIAAAAVALIVVAATTATLVALRPPDVRVRALDVGQGDAFLIETDGRLALIDGGPEPARLLAALGATLPPWSRRIDIVVLTHAHLDHGAGLLAVLDRYEVGIAIEPVGLNAGALTDAWSVRITKAGVERRAVSVGARVRLGHAVLHVLSPNGNPAVDVPSLVLRLERGTFSMLFMADATDVAIADLLLAPERLRARVYVPPHHGARTPHGPGLVAAVRPEAAVLSVGAANRYGHPTPETLQALAGIAAYRTDRDGTVEIFADGTRINVRTRAVALPPARGRSVPYAPPAR